LEVTANMVGDWVEEFAGDLQCARIDGRAIVAEAPSHMPALRKIGDSFFRGWARRVQG
jgi:hypothetical protein